MYALLYTEIFVLYIVHTIESRVSAYERSTITAQFQCTGHLLYVNIEVGGADCVGVATTKCVSCSSSSLQHNKNACIHGR